MQTTVDRLKKGDRATITGIDADALPLKLLEMGCLPGNSVELLQIAPLGDPMYLDINGARLAIRKETAKHISVEVTS
ncbi:FeoA family protein [Flavobacterium selenitireducens]|uniref:FeoA family protein n=1 Tax=Flavobacterium selenitireducens TaxID=2722704 RepID=UPI00168BDAFE|nr:FeoA family protein [Flavobacterium selenitireducens]MBD3581681.1 ferrous iron transport protein A [Flavobacterium selenitireducens]